MSARAWVSRRSRLRGRCNSNIHRKRVVAVVTGTFDCSHINGKPPVPAQYCARCARYLQMAGLFTPDD